MSVVDFEIIAASTDQVVSESFSSAGPRTICASGLFGAAEGAKIQFTHNGSKWQDLYLNGILQEIVAVHTMVTIIGPGVFRIIKSATAEPISIVTWFSEVDR